MVSKQESRIYYIEKGRLIFVENDLYNPNRIAVSVSSGTTIQVYDESLIGFMSDGKFYSWTLKGFSTKLAKIISINDIRSVTVIRMDTPCCTNLTTMVQDAIKLSRKPLPFQTVSVFVDAEEVD